MMSADPAPILDLIEAFRRSKTLFTAVSLGVFDRLAGSGVSLPELAAALNCSADGLGRLLDACVGLGLLCRIEDHYGNSALADKYLVTSSPDNLAGYILYSDRTLYPMWAHLEDAVREGSHRWEQTFGKKDALFDHFFRTEGSKRAFLGGMHGFGNLSSPTVVHTFDLTRFKTMVDLGGASGHLSIAACETYPHLQAIVFDLPSVQSFATETIAASPVADRVKFMAGDFFSDELPPADLYALGRILHDWNENKIRVLLKRIYASLPSGGGLLIAEALLADDHAGPVPAQMQNLNMLVCTEGRERTCSEYRALLDAAGFRQVQCRRTGSVLDAVLARKP